MAVEKVINKVVSIGAREIRLNDDNKSCEIDYWEYENDVATRFIQTQKFSFNKLMTDNLEKYTSVMTGIQYYSDLYNPETYITPVEEPVEEIEFVVEEPSEG